MKSTLHCCLVIILALMPLATSAQDIRVIDTSSARRSLVAPAMVMTPVTVQPDCHTYTGCGVIIVNKHYYQKPKHYKHKQHHTYHQSCCVMRGCYVHPGMGECY